LSHVSQWKRKIQRESTYGIAPIIRGALAGAADERTPIPPTAMIWKWAIGIDVDVDAG
jgi:hypothetical protein